MFKLRLNQCVYFLLVTGVFFTPNYALGVSSNTDLWKEKFNLAKAFIDSQRVESVDQGLFILEGIDEPRAIHLRAATLISRDDKASISAGLKLMHTLPDRTSAFLMADTSVVELQMVEAIIRHLPSYEDNRNIVIQIPFAVNGWYSQGSYNKNGVFVHTETVREYVGRVYAAEDQAPKGTCLALGRELRPLGSTIILASKAKTDKQKNGYLSKAKIEKISQCAERGWPEFQNIYGMLIRHQDNAQTREWVHKSVLQGHAPAAYNLVVLSLIDNLSDEYFNAALNVLGEYSGAELAFSYVFDRVMVAFADKSEADKSFRSLMKLSGSSSEVELYAFHLLSRNFIRPDKGLVSSAALDFSVDFGQVEFEKWIKPFVDDSFEAAMQYDCTYHVANYHFRSAPIDRAMSVCGKYIEEGVTSLIPVYKRLEKS